MPAKCPICETELLGGEFCPKCRRSVAAEQLSLKVEILEDALRGWERECDRLQKEVDHYYHSIRAVHDFFKSADHDDQLCDLCEQATHMLAESIDRWPEEDE